MSLTPKELAEIRLEDKQDKNLWSGHKSDKVFQSEWEKVNRTYHSVLSDEYTKEWDIANGFTSYDHSNVTHMRSRENHSKYSDEVVEKINGMRNQGIPFGKIAVKMSMTQSSVVNVYYRHCQRKPSQST